MIFNSSKEKELMAISRMLGRMYKCGIPINSCLEVLIEVTSNKEYKDSLIKVLRDTTDGKSLSESFKKFNNLYPTFFTGFMSLGENTGKLYEVLTGLSMFYEKYNYVLNKIKNILFYPSFILVSMIILIILLIKNIIPSVFEIYESLNIKMPGISQFFYDLNIGFQKYTIIYLIMVSSVSGLILYFFIILFQRVKTKLLSRIKIFKQFMEYMIILIFSIITSTGINISDALSYCENSIKIKFLNEKIININNSIINGKSLTSSLEDTYILSRFSLSMIRVNEESGSLEEGFKELCEILEKDLFENIEKKLNMISPCCIGFLGILICIILLTFIVPIFDGMSSGIVL